MKLSGHMLASMAFAAILAMLVIVAAGYYESSVLLVFQFLFIAGPTLGPFLALPKSGGARSGGWFLVAFLLTAGWAYVVYIDTRPYEGGGASLAILFGWFSCFVALVLAALIAAMHRWASGRR